MSEYLILAENITFKNDRLTCINIYDKFSAFAMPSEFKFDFAIICGPNWNPGKHNLLIKAIGSNGKEVSLGSLTVNIPNEDFVYNAYANDCKIVMDYSISSLTFVVFDNGKEIISRKYPVNSLLIPKKISTVTSENKNIETFEESNSDNKKYNSKQNNKTKSVKKSKKIK